jgi:hypothetical protein
MYLQGKQAEEIMREGKMVPGSMIIGEHSNHAPAEPAASGLQHLGTASISSIS